MHFSKSIPKLLHSLHKPTLPANHTTAIETDSFMLGNDTLCSCTMSGDKNHFENLRENPPFKNVGGIGGSKLSIQGIGTFVFRIQDDSGETCTIQIPNSLYVPDLLLLLVSPQHSGQAIRDQRSTYVINNGDECKSCWGGCKHCKTIQHDKSKNAPTLKTATGTIIYHSFEACFQAMDASHLWHHIKVYQLPNHTANIPEEFIANKLIHQRSNWMSDSEGAIADEEAIKVGNVKSQLNIKFSQSCPFHPTGNHKWGECNLFSQLLSHKFKSTKWSLASWW